MMQTQEIQYGKLALTNIMASVWLGDWDRYEEIFQQMDEELKENFPFHQEYNREEVQLWHENHFYIPGNYFVSPYFSSYKRKNEDAEERKKNLLCLIGTYEKMGFYFPLQQEMYPDHIGCLMSFVSALQQEKIKAVDNGEHELLQQLESLENDTVQNYIIPVLKGMKEEVRNKIQHSFFKKFIPFNYEAFQEDYQLA